MASRYGRREVELPLYLETMTTGTLPEHPVPKIPPPPQEIKRDDKGKYCDSLVVSQQMLLENIRHLRSEVERTNREINRTRSERLYADILKDEVNEEREMPYGSRFYRPKIHVVKEKTTTTTKTETVD